MSAQPFTPKGASSTPQYPKQAPPAQQQQQQQQQQPQTPIMAQSPPSTFQNGFPNLPTFSVHQPYPPAYAQPMYPNPYFNPNQQFVPIGPHQAPQMMPQPANGQFIFVFSLLTLVLVPYAQNPPVVTQPGAKTRPGRPDNRIR